MALERDKILNTSHHRFAWTKNFVKISRICVVCNRHPKLYLKYKKPIYKRIKLTKYSLITKLYPLFSP